jgi:PAS domain S-box-containing protein
MRRRDQLAWRLTFVVIAIVAVTIVANGVATTRTSRRYALGSARYVLKFNSESIRSGIERLMMSRNNAAVQELIEDMSRGSSVYRDIRLVSHPSGQVVVSRRDRSGIVLDQSDRACATCHTGETPTLIHESADIAVTLPDGGHILHVVTPILNRPSCQTAACHAHAGSKRVLGFLYADYSLDRVDELVRGVSVSIALSATLAVLLLASVLWFMFRLFLGRPLGNLMTGLQALAANDLAFRFRSPRRDEIGLLEGSFDQMAEQIQRQQTELRDAREYLESIVENSADIIITVGPDGLIQTFNRGAEQALGYQRQELSGKHIEMLFVDPRERDAAIAGLRVRDNVANFETRFLAKSGKTRHVLLTLSRLRDRHGNAIGTLGISKDITTEKELQQKLIQSESAAAIGRAVTGIQHAIKNMLNTLRGGLYLVRVGNRKENLERVHEGCEMISEGLTRITDLSHGMLKHAREWKIEPEYTDLEQLAEEVVAALRQSPNEQQVMLRTEIAHGLPHVRCDPGLLHMSLVDVVTNALEACEEKEYEDTETPEVVLRVTLRPEGEGVAIEIQDNGVGMSEEILGGVFTPFFSTKKKWGTGLGLALTARIIALHGGTVTAKSSPDGGSTFQIILPVAGPQAKSGVDDGKDGDGH